REQCLVDTTTPFKQGREERSLAQLRDPQIQLPSGRGDRLGAGAVALDDPVRSPLERARANERGSFCVDQFLIELLGRGPDPVGHLSGLQLGQQIKQGRLVKRHRAMCPSVSNFCRFSLTIARWLAPWTTRPRTTPPDGTSPTF